jgi:glutamyl/glutaminyl-tRNA synthetase
VGRRAGLEILEKINVSGLYWNLNPGPSSPYPDFYTDYIHQLLDNENMY